MSLEALPPTLLASSLALGGYAKALWPQARYTLRLFADSHESCAYG